MRLLNNRYRIIRKVDAGATGVVYLSEDLNSGQQLILKVINFDLPDSPNLEFFKREYSILSSITHPNIVRVYDFTSIWSVDGHNVPPQYYLFSMEYIDGWEFSSGVREIQDPGTLYRILGDMIRTLHFIHFSGFLHNDIRSKNIFITRDNQVKFLDFGISQRLSGSNAVNRFNKASDFKALFSLVERELISKCPLAELFLVQARSILDFETGFNLEKIFDIYNAVSDEYHIIPAHPSIDNCYTVKNLGLERTYKPLKKALDLKTESNKLIILTGDVYSESIPFFYQVLAQEKINQKFIIRITANTLEDTIREIFIQLDELDTTGSVVDKKIPEIGAFFNPGDNPMLKGDEKYMTFNRILSILRTMADKFDITFVITYIESKREEISDLFLYLINSMNQNGITWFFYDTNFPARFRQALAEDRTMIFQFSFDHLDFEQFSYTVSSILLIPDDVATSYRELMELLYEKSHGKCVLLSTLIRDLLDNGMLSYDNGRYQYQYYEIRKHKFSFTFDERRKKELSGLDPTDKKVLSLLAYYEKHINLEYLKHIFYDIPDLKERMLRLEKQNTIVMHGDPDNPRIWLNGLKLIEYLSSYYPVDDTSASRTIVLLLRDYLPDSLESSYYLITKLERFAFSHPYLSGLHAMRLLERFSRENKRSEVIKTAEFLKNVMEFIPDGSFYNKCLSILGLFHYYSDEDQEAIRYFQSVDPEALKGRNILEFYMFYARALFFSGAPEEAIQIAQKGSAAAKAMGERDFRFYFLNVKALIAAGCYKSAKAIKYYEVIFGYVKEKGLSQALSNYISNYFNLLINTGQAEKVLELSRELHAVISTDTYIGKKSLVQLLTETSYALINLNKYEEALDSLNRAFTVAEAMESGEDMIRILNFRVTAAYYMHFNNIETRDDLNKIVDIAKKHSLMSKASFAMYNLIETHMETGNMNKALDTFREIARYIIGPDHGRNIPDLLNFYRYGAIINMKMGARKQAFRFLNMQLKKIYSMTKEERAVNYENYLYTKSEYYKYLHKDKRHYDTLKALLEKDRMNRESGYGYFPQQEIRAILLEQVLVADNLGCTESRDRIMKQVEKDYGVSTDPWGEINWDFYRALCTPERRKKISYFKKALRFCVKRRDFSNIDVVVIKYLPLLKKKDFNYYNSLYLLYLSLKRFYSNIPPDYRESWINMPYITEMISVLGDNLDMDNPIIASDEKVVHKKISSLFTVDKVGKNIQLVKKLNEDLWTTSGDDIIPKIIRFLKTYFKGERIIFRDLHEEGKEGYVSYSSKDLYAREDMPDEALIQKSFSTGDFQIKLSTDFGRPITTLVIPILNPEKKQLSYSGEKRSKSTTYTDVYQGYIYIDTKFPLSNISPHTVSIAKICVELMASQMLHRQFRKGVMVDKTTGIMNRHYFLKELKRKMSHFRQGKNNILFLMADIDHFKKINDRYGHQRGDKVLYKIAQTLKKGIRKDDLLGRYGGEEFIAVLFNISQREGKLKAEQLRRSIESSKIISGSKLTVSIGATFFPENSEWINILINQADTALLLAKKEGRNRVVFWDKELKSVEAQKDPLYGIITDDFSRSETVIRNLLEYLEYKADNPTDSFVEMVKRLKVSIPYKYCHYELTGGKQKVAHSNKGYLPGSPAYSHKGGKVEINWAYSKKDGSPLYQDLIYTVSMDKYKGHIVFSSPVTESDYGEGHFNLIERFCKIWECKI